MKRHSIKNEFARRRHFAAIRAANKARQAAALQKAALARYGLANPPALGRYLDQSNRGLLAMANALGVMS